MRNLLFVASAAGVLAFGAAGAANAANPNAPNWSPYAIGVYDPPPPALARRIHRDDRALRSGMTEGRAAYQGAGGIYGRPGNDYGPGYEYPSPASPYKWAASPEDFH